MGINETFFTTRRAKDMPQQPPELGELQNMLDRLSLEMQGNHNKTFDTDEVMRQLQEVSETIRLSSRYPRPPELAPDMPWNESAEPEYEFDPYVYTSTMSAEDFKRAQDLYFADPKNTPPVSPPRKTVYVCSPLAGEIEENIRKAREYSRFVARQGATPIAPHITELFDDAVPEERELGLEMGLDYLRKADELWVFGDRISDGMAAEIKLAQTELNIPIYHIEAPSFEMKPFELFEKGELTMAQNDQTKTRMPESLEIVVSPDMELERMEPEEMEPDEALADEQEPLQTEPAPQTPAAQSAETGAAAPARETNFTRDQLQRAKDVDLLNYLRTHGYTVKAHGSAYKVQLNGHDSDTVFPDTNSWYSFRTGEGRDIVDWLVKRENKTMVQAVQELTGETFDPQKLFRRARASTEEAAKTLELPQASERQSRMFAYLLKTRKLDQTLVKQCVDNGLLYQGVTVARKEAKEYRFENCCFVGKDETGAPKSVMLRSMNTEGRIFKGNTAGSDREYGWMLPGKPDAKRLTVCESPIEALSVATLHKRHGEAWDNEHYLSLNGITAADKSGALMERALRRALDAHPKVDTINIALNNDQNAEINHGKTVGEQIKRLFLGHYKIVESYPQLKDYNDELRREAVLRERAQVELPGKSANNNYTFQYLTQQRQLDVALVREWIADGRLYQSDNPATINGKEQHNSQMVFVERNKNGDPTYAMGVYFNYRAQKADFKRDYRGEETSGNYLTQSGSNHTLMVFNNPVSMLAHQSYLRAQNVQSENNYLCCLRDPAGAVREYMQQRVDITEIKVMLDTARSVNKDNQLVDYRELSFQKIQKTFASKVSVERKYPKGVDLSRDLITLKQQQKNQTAPTNKSANGFKIGRKSQTAPTGKMENGLEMER